MKQFILPSPPDSAGVVRLSGRDFHYLVRVRRVKEGVVFKARLPDGAETRVLVQSLADGCLTGECLPMELIDEMSLPPIILFQALPKGAKLDLIVRQAAEGGIAEIRPFVSDYSIPRAAGGPANGAGRVERWRRIIREARQQSGSVIATEIAAPCTVEALLEYWEAVKGRNSRPLGIILHQAPVGPSPLAGGGFHEYLSSDPEGLGPGLVVLAVGPEGGFSPEEVSRFLAAGFKPLVIGNTVLRTETAALYAAAAVRIILLERAAWTPSLIIAKR